MDRRTFSVLCELLRNTGRLKTNGLVSVEEQVCMFLHILAHHVKNRTIRSRFYRSGETISRYFNSVLCAVLQLHNHLLVSPDPVAENCSDERWKWFKNCLGALDGTYIKVHVPEVDKPRFRSRKCEIATNILGACSRDMMFTFVFPGWEGSASDSRVLHDALSRPTGMKILNEMDVGGRSQTNEQDRRACRHIWTKEEEETILSIMDEIVANGGRADCGSFKAGTLKIIESRLTNILPNCGLKASPHIESKVKTWKKDYRVVYDMINTSGFGWNNVRKCVEVDSNEAWHSYVQHHKQAKGWRDKPFPLYERLAYIFGKDRATGKTAYAPKNLAADVEEDDNFDNEVEMPGNFSPMSVNQTDSNQSMHPTSSQSLSKKRFRSRDPIVRSMDRFASVMKDAIEKSNDTLDKFCQLLAKNKMTENQVIANDLQKMQLPLSDQVRVMQKFMQKPEVAEIFKAQQSEEQKLQFVASLLSGVFDD
ncbi:hypothetical protein LWI29_013056 [Acer saccharum]|uniref:Myb/SANT-like domain-containing protein n=1 Tax=Acer saccharum TaxID=4024 RepID=A0AA39RCV5_ACESA|nr:hypothetical protein LWI29_013056 [Acer saccharum]